MINEAFFALAEGDASADEIDEGMKLGCNHPMGPLALADLIGLDVLLSVMEVLHREFGDDKYRPRQICGKWSRRDISVARPGVAFSSIHMGADNANAKSGQHAVLRRLTRCRKLHRRLAARDPVRRCASQAATTSSPERS